MPPSLKITQKLINRFSKSETESTTGKIYGILAQSSLTILGVQLDTENTSGNFLINSLPAEIYVCGIINISNDTFDEQSTKNRLSEVYVTDNPVFLNYNRKSAELVAYFYLNGQLEKSKFLAVNEQDVLSQFMYVRLQAAVPLSCELGRDSMGDAFLGVRKSIASGVMTFDFENSNIYLVGNENEAGIIGIGGNPGVGEVFDEGSAQTEGNKRKKKQLFEVDVLNCNMLKKISIDAVDERRKHAPLCVVEKKLVKMLNCNVLIDTLSMVHRKTKITSLYEILVESAIRFVRLLEGNFLSNFERITKPETFHFYQADCCHFITRVYLKTDLDDSLRGEREKLHKELLLDLSHPYFRRANAHTFKLAKNNPAEAQILLNPHETVKLTDNGGQLALVQGKYHYYHYCQNKMDDNGWGCAYRSLQTLASWFTFQGYATGPVPTFQAIQECLVEIGDKPKSFLGSKQWIGSTEVNFVLNTLFGVDCKILYVSSGEEMASKGPELVNHFLVYGTPVMIGGGVLAHTILGVDYNSTSGNLMFLILDPHYTGDEDLHTIVNKGWCGWKGVDFWNKSAYYNMCFPLVPVMI